MRRAVLGTLCVAILVGGGAPEGKQVPRLQFIVPTADDLTRVFTAYAGGDDRAVEQWSSHQLNWSQAALRDLDAILRRSGATRRMRLAFVLELVGASQPMSVPERVLAVGRKLIEDGAKPLGVDPAEDAFEILWHHSAIATLQMREMFDAQQRHLDDILPRFEAARRRGVVLSTRLALARGIAAVGRCCKRSLPGYSLAGPGLDRPPPPDAPGIDGAVLFFKQAAAIPALEVEARIRAGVALEGVGRHEAALEWFDNVPAHDDVPLGYVQHLVRGHALDALNRPRDAAAAYQRAQEYMPTFQLAAIGQAAALLRAGDVEAADALADRTRRLPKISPAGDPRLIFRRADARFLLDWVAEIRRLRK